MGLKAYIYPLVFKRQEFRSIFGQWGLVTGCTQGIGREYALGLAARGMDVVLVSRNREKLEEVEREIEAMHDVKTKVIVADLADANEVHMVAEQVEGMDVGILVNNVGMAGEHMMPFLEQDKETVANMMTVNMMAGTMLTHAILPSMKKKDRGAIINISSVACMQPMPYIALYAATKHFIHAFTEALEYENKDSGVIFQEISPGAVETALTKYLPKSKFNPRASPSEFVGSALGTLGYTSWTCGWWPHSLQLLLFHTVPDIPARVAMRSSLEYTYRDIVRNKHKRY